MLEIRKLKENDGLSLSEMLTSSGNEHSKWFTPFAFDYESICSVLRNACADLYFGFFVKDIIVGFYLLRGFDEGFSRPSYGIWVKPEYQNMGLAHLSLAHCLTICQLLHVSELMLKVHPLNYKAKRIYEKSGFVHVGTDEKNGNYILVKRLIE